MLGHLAASKAAKIAALCICPVGAAVVTTQVPQVRSAVHKMTAPKHVPARRIAPRATPPVAQTAMASPCPGAIPVVLQGADPLALALQSPGESRFSGPIPLTGTNFSAPTARVAGAGPSPLPPAFSNESLPVLPEPGTWMQFGLGFAVLGSALRSPRLRAKGATPKAPQQS